MASAEQKTMNWLVFLLFVVFPFGQLGRIEISPAVTVHLMDVVVFLIGLSWLWGFFVKKKRLSIPLARPLLSFTGIAFFSLLVAPPAGGLGFSIEEVVIGSLYLLRWASYVLFYFAVWEAVKRRRLTKARIINSLLVAGSFIAVFGLVQYFFFPDTRALLLLGWDEHYFRLIGTFFDPGFTSILLVFFTLLLFSRQWKSRGEKSVALFLVVVAILSVALTFSRAGYFALVAGLTVWYIVRRNLKIFLGSVVLFLVFVVFSPKPGGEGVLLSRTSTVYTRLESYNQALEIGVKNPLFGTGFNLYRFATGSLVSHSGAGSDSSLLFVFATTGVFGLLTYLWLLKDIFSIAWKRRMTADGLALLSTSFALFLHSFFNNSLFYPWVMAWLFLLLAVQTKENS